MVLLTRDLPSVIVVNELGRHKSQLNYEVIPFSRSFITLQVLKYIERRTQEKCSNMEQ
jgi:hypothetical protein